MRIPVNGRFENLVQRDCRLRLRITLRGSGHSRRAKCSTSRDETVSPLKWQF